MFSTKISMTIDRCGIVTCAIWRNLGIDGDFAILVHYIRRGQQVWVAAAFTSYNGELTDITDKFRNLRIVPDWRTRIAGLTDP